MTTTLVPPRPHAGSLLKELDLTKEQFLALVFEKASTRTRCAFEVVPVFDQAENRLHTIKAVLVSALETAPRSVQGR